MKKLIQALIAASLLSMPALALAEDAPAKPKIPIPALDDVLEAWGLTLNGYLDTSFNLRSGNGLFTSGVSTRVFDNDRNSFSVQQAALILAKQPKEGFGGLLNLTAGKDADVIGAFGSGSNTDNFDVTQAFVQYATGPVTVIGGKYVTLAGAEVINSTANTIFSRSILFGYAIPFTHTGVRATYALSDTVSLIGGVNNGWDDLRDTNSAKTVELGVSYAPLKNLSLAAQSYIGRERLCGSTCNTGPEGQRFLIDLVGTFNATDKLTLVLNFDYARQSNATAFTPSATSNAKWQGVAGYATYQINDKWRTTLRGEYFDDKDGYRTGVAQKWKEVTLDLSYLAHKNFELRTDLRFDRSNVASFVDANGVTAGKNQVSLGLDALFKF
jgi:hypothetical protein